MVEVKLECPGNRSLPPLAHKNSHVIFDALSVGKTLATNGKLENYM
jgi:hypothetical protein